MKQTTRNLAGYLLISAFTLGAPAIAEVSGFSKYYAHRTIEQDSYKKLAFCKTPECREFAENLARGSIDFTAALLGFSLTAGGLANIIGKLYFGAERIKRKNLGYLD